MRFPFKKVLVSAIIGFVVLAGVINPRDLFGANKGFYAALTDTTDITVVGPHRFLTISGLKGFRPTSMHTKAFVETKAHHNNKGTISLWFSPLEDLSNWITRPWVYRDIKDAQVYPFISDVYPPRNKSEMGFGLYWTIGYKPFSFTYNNKETKMKESSSRTMWAEDMTILKGMWYHVVVTWDKEERVISMYVNGFFVAYIENVDFVTEWGDKLYLGNPMFVIRDLRIEGHGATREKAAKIYSENRPATNDPADEILRDKYTVVDRPALDIKLDETWEEAYACTFLEEGDLDGWIFQTGEIYKDQFVVKITEEGLYISTPDFVDNETRMYLWSPVTFEGDQWIEFEFKAEEDDGLALLLVAASGPQRNDFFADDQMMKSGSMGFLLSQTRNYHWEFLRKYPDIRKNVETQFFAKNPWAKMMHYGAADRIKVGKWHKLRFVMVGHRLHGSIDGKTVFDVEDNFNDHNGPVLDFGRIGFRLMYKTTMRFRNFEVYVK